MSRCHVSDQIADFCNEEEVCCPECEANMYEDIFDREILVCSECKHEVDTGEDE